MAEALREITEELAAIWINLFREQSYVIGVAENVLEQRTRLIHPSHERELANAPVADEPGPLRSRINKPTDVDANRTR